tara:strand:+ start:381 stop:596 length:216 start_codon:yes stop_codon:yes gene_type:complete
MPKALANGCPLSALVAHYFGKVGKALTACVKGGIPKDGIVHLRIIEREAIALIEDTERSSLGVFIVRLRGL